MENDVLDKAIDGIIDIRRDMDKLQHDMHTDFSVSPVLFEAAISILNKMETLIGRMT